MSERDSWRRAALGFVSRHGDEAAGAGHFRYSASAGLPTLYASCYAALTLSLTGELRALPEDELDAWGDYLNRHQDDDGLFRDPVIFDQGWYAGDPLWCGRSHLSCHVLPALTCLGRVAPKPFRWLRPWYDPDYMVGWLASRDWGRRVGWTGNEIMNVGTLLQYGRDVHSSAPSGRAVAVMLDWLSENHIRAATGVWGDVDVSDSVWRSHAVQAAYHWWPLFFYDGRPIPHLERAIDTVLATQNSAGGFGWGVHSPDSPLLSSACEDIDSIDPLCRMMQVSDHRRDEICVTLARAADWVLTNQLPDGGFGFIKDRPFEYGHPELSGQASQGAMFPTWFRTLSLALIGKALPEHGLGQMPWEFVRCPGYQFW